MTIINKIQKLGKVLKIGCSDDSITTDVAKSRAPLKLKKKSSDYDSNSTIHNDGIIDTGSMVARSKSSQFPAGLKNLLFDKAESKAIDIIGNSNSCSTSSSIVTPKLLKGHSLSRFELQSSHIKSGGAGSSGLQKFIHPSYLPSLPSSIYEIRKKLYAKDWIRDNLASTSTSQALASTSSDVPQKSGVLNQESIFALLRKNAGWEQSIITDIGCKLWFLAILYTCIWWSVLPPELINIGKLKYLCDWELIGYFREKELPRLSSRDVDIRVLIDHVQINFDPVQFHTSFDPKALKPLHFNPLNLKIGERTPGVEELRVLKEAQLHLNSELTQQSEQQNYTKAGAMVFAFYLVSVFLIFNTIEYYMFVDAQGSTDIQGSTEVLGSTEIFECTLHR